MNNNNTARICSICNKFLYTYLLLTHNEDDTFEETQFVNGMAIPKDYICQGHASSVCPTCGWNTPQKHTPTDCALLSAIGNKKRTEIPDVFYDAFDEEQ